MVTVRPAITPNITINCNNPVTLSTTTTGATAPVAYAWSATGGGTIVAGQASSASPAITSVGTYSVTLTDANTCTGSATAAFTIGDCVALKLELVSFAVSRKGTTALLAWKIAQAEDGARFEVERSGSNGSTWDQIGIVRTNASDLSYSFQDEKAGLMGGTFQYRLKMADDDGSVFYSPIRNLSFDRSDALVIYPNPVIDGQKLTLVIGRPEQISGISIFNTMGRQIFHSDVVTDIDIDGFASGFYILRVNYVNGSNNSFKITKR